MYTRQPLKAPCSQGYQWSEGGWCLLSFEARFPSQRCPVNTGANLTNLGMSKIELNFGIGCENEETSVRNYFSKDLLRLCPFSSWSVGFFGHGRVLSEGEGAWWGVGREGTWVVFARNDSVDPRAYRGLCRLLIGADMLGAGAYVWAYVRVSQKSGLTHSNVTRSLSVSLNSCFEMPYCKHTGASKMFTTSESDDLWHLACCKIYKFHVS